MPAVDILTLNQQVLDNLCPPYQDKDLDWWIRCDLCGSHFHLSCGLMHAGLPESSAESLHPMHRFECCKYTFDSKLVSVPAENAS